LNGKYDLHAHTTASDGTLSPTELIEHALRQGLNVLAVTDHDSTEGVHEALVRAAGTRLEVWPGVEISTDVTEAEVHVLGYFVNTTDPEFQAILGRLRESRVGRAEQMVAKLTSLGMPLSFERVRQLAGTGAIGRPHVAQAMVEQGYVPSAKEAFTLYLGRNGPAYVDRFKLTPEDAVQLIQRAGGMPVLAHPTYCAGNNPNFDLTGFVRELREAGLAGIECYYADYSPEVVESLVGIARELNLIPTGGTDYHGRNQSFVELGERTVPVETLERMRAWRLARG